MFWRWVLVIPHSRSRLEWFEDMASWYPLHFSIFSSICSKSGFSHCVFQLFLSFSLVFYSLLLFLLVFASLCSSILPSSHTPLSYCSFPLSFLHSPRRFIHQMNQTVKTLTQRQAWRFVHIYLRLRRQTFWCSDETLRVDSKWCISLQRITCFDLVCFAAAQPKFHPGR